LTSLAHSTSLALWRRTAANWRTGVQSVDAVAVGPISDVRVASLTAPQAQVVLNLSR